ncbi:MAG TPA: GAF domain-containing protein, partial [Acidobacteriota bacterium]|nr:GAF domain-containing protein [Acidobacteriota bacterium]
MADPESLAAMRILALMFPPAMIAEPELLPSVVFTLINQCLTKGNSVYSAIAYALYGMNISQDPEGISRGNQFGQLALQLLGSSENNKMRNRVREIVYCFIDSWQSKHLRDVMEDMRRLVQSSLESGEIEIACNQLMSLCILLYVVGEPLESARALSAEYIRSIGELKQGFQLRIAKVWAQLQLNLSGLAEDPKRMVGVYFNEDVMLPQLEHELGLTRFYSYLPIAIHHLFVGDYEKSLKYTQMSANYRPQMFGFPVAVTHSTYHALAMLQLYPKAGTKTQKEYLQALEPIRQRMASLFRRGSINWQHDYYLIEAETARVLGKFDRALQYYEKAIATARNNRYPNFEALGCELAGRFYLDRGLKGPSEYYLAKAYALYQNWGAILKARDLEHRYPNLLNPQQVPAQASPYQQGSTLTSSGLDLDSSLKALRALSSETDLEALLNRMMEIVMEHAGAEKGVLLLKQDGRWLIQATGDFQKRTYTVLLNLPYTQESSDQENSPAPTGVVNLCLRTEQTLLVPNALSDTRFNSDPYIRQHGVKSILCLPLLYQARLNGVLYLENRLTSEVFGHLKMEMLELLCTQFSISFENALLYQTLAERLSFEKLISALSAAFVNLPADKVNRQLELWLEKLVNFLEVDRGALYEFSADHDQLFLTRYYAGPATPSPPDSLKKFPWYANKIAHGRMVILRRLQDLPSPTDEEKRHFMTQGIVSYIGVPMSVGGTLLGVIEFASFHRENSWSTDIIERLRLIEEIFAQALKRKINEETLQSRTTELRETAEKLKNLSEHLQDVREHERGKIAREIHDELGQTLTVLRMDTSWIARHIHDDPTLLSERLNDMIAMIDSATGTVQTICSELRPHMLDVLGLFDAIEWQVEEFQR